MKLRLRTPGFRPYSVLVLLLFVVPACYLIQYGDPPSPTPNPTDVYEATQKAVIRATEFAESEVVPQGTPIAIEASQYASVRRGQNMAFSPKGDAIAIGSISGHPIYLFEMPAGKLIGTLDLDLALPIFGVVFSPGGGDIVVNSCSSLEEGSSGCSDHKLTFWNSESMTQKSYLISGFNGISMAFNRDGSSLASHDVSTLILWDAKTGQMLFELAHQERGSIQAIAFSPDSRSLAVGIYETVHVWDLGDEPKLVARLTDLVAPLYHLAFSPDGSVLTAGTSGGCLYFWEAETMSFLNQVCSINSRANFEYTPNGEYIVIGGYTNTVLIYRIRDSRFFSIPLDPYISGHSIAGLAISPDGSTLAVLSDDHSIYVLDLDDLANLPGG